MCARCRRPGRARRTPASRCRTRTRSSSHFRSTARARRSSPIGAPTARCAASSSGTRSTRPSPVSRPRGKCASSTTMPAAGANTTRRATGRRSRTAARPYDGPAARVLRRGLQGARRNLLGDPVVATTPAAARVRSLAARAYGLRAPPLALEQRAGQDRGSHPLDVRRPVAGRLRALHVPRPADLRVRLDAEGNPKDRYGRNVYIDTLNSAFGPGWKRESGILVHKPNGTFCHSFVPQSRSRATRAKRCGHLHPASATASP